MVEDSISRFWDKFIVITRRYGVKSGVERWYVKHAEEYIKAYNGRTLSEHSAQNVEQYLKRKGRSKRLKNWQDLQVELCKQFYGLFSSIYCNAEVSRDAKSWLYRDIKKANLK